MEDTDHAMNLEELFPLAPSFYTPAARRSSTTTTTASASTATPTAASSALPEATGATAHAPIDPDRIASRQTTLKRRYLDACQKLALAIETAENESPHVFRDKKNKRPASSAMGFESVPSSPITTFELVRPAPATDSFFEDTGVDRVRKSMQAGTRAMHRYQEKEMGDMLANKDLLTGAARTLDLRPPLPEVHNGMPVDPAGPRPGSDEVLDAMHELRELVRERKAFLSERAAAVLKIGAEIIDDNRLLHAALQYELANKGLFQRTTMAVISASRLTFEENGDFV